MKKNNKKIIKKGIYLKKDEYALNKGMPKQTLKEQPKCIICHKPVNQMIQPWDYYFPSQIFHLGCKITMSNQTLKEQNLEKEFYKEWKRATGERNIVGDLIIKDFILSLLKEEYKRGYNDCLKEFKIPNKYGEKSL